MKPETIALHGGSHRADPTTGSVAVPITNDPIPGLPGANAQYSGVPSQPANIQPTSNTGAASGTPQRKNESSAPANVAPNLTFASLPLTLAGRTLPSAPYRDTMWVMGMCRDLCDEDAVVGLFAVERDGRLHRVIVTPRSRRC